MSNVNITKVEALPAEAQRFVNFLKDLVTNGPEFIKTFLPELEDYRLGNADRYWGYEDEENEGKETYIQELINASSDMHYGYDTEGKYAEGVTNFLDDYNGSCFSGEYRLTMVFDGYDYVVKFPIQKTDACLIESNNYAYAVAENLERFFAPAYNLGALACFEELGYHGNIYIQKRVQELIEHSHVEGIDWDLWEYGPVDYEDSEWRYYDKNNEYFSDEDAETFNIFLENFDGDMFRYAGIVFFLWLHNSENEMHRLNDFLFEYHINDLHPCNVGFIDGDYHKAPIILDYAGYLG
jgi:hypothetical protein